MAIPCEPDHVCLITVPDGLALYSFMNTPVGYDEEWLGNEAILERIDRLDGPAVYVNLSRANLVNSDAISKLIRLRRRVQNRRGRLALCNARPSIQEIFRIILPAHQLARLEWQLTVEERFPWGALAPDPSWLDWGGGIIVALARTVKETRDFTLLPVLGDALEDAGCTLPDVLEHCRGPGPHRRDCWVIQMLLDTD